MSVTINDVALRAGVSMKTVSRVINKEPSVRKDTYNKVMAAVKELNYQPNIAARNLASTKSYAIGFIYSNPNAYYVIDMQNGILAECRERGYELLIHPCSADSSDIIQDLTDMVRNSRIAGLVLTPPFSESSTVVRALNKMDLQFVRIISGAKSNSADNNCILIDDRAAAFSITQHLIELGHTRIGFICGGPEHKSSGERLEGYLAALREADIRVSKPLIIDGDYSFESGVNGANKLLGRKRKPSAIFASNDEIAAGALFAARLMGVDIPNDLSIVGFEDSPFSRQTWPKLTTAHQPNELIAQRAAALLIDKIRGSELSVDRKSRKFCPQLIVRDSTTQISTD